MPKVMKAGRGFIVKHAGEWFRVPKKLVKNGDVATKKLDDLAAKRARENAARRAAGKKARKASKRDLFMGKTPGKGSPVGTEVKQRMRQEGTLRGRAPREQVLTGNPPQWTPISKTDMGHKVDAVDFWNNGAPPKYPTPGKDAGPRSDYVRDFMNDADNYELQGSGPNRSAGASSGGSYDDPS